MLSAAAIQKFRESIRGQSFCPGDPGYDPARAIPNAMIDRRPALIARCAGAADVIACVRFAREQDLLLSVRGGGHSVAGKAVCDGALMVDLSAMKGIRVDPVRRTVRAQTGLKLGEFDRETQAFGLATTLGVVSATGIAGLTLGGGWGHLHAKYGLAVDNVIGADVVTADGQLLTANASENPDLFWGIRGGSGNFGIVTSLEYRLHEVGPVLGGAVFYPAAKAKEVLHFWREYAAGSPDELVTQGGSFCLPDGVPVFAIAACYCGQLSEGEKVLKPLRSFGSPLADNFGAMSYVQLQSMFDPFFPPGRLTYVKSNFIRSLNDEAIDTIVQYVGQSPSPHTFAPFIEHWHGAATRVAPTDTAFPHRQYSYNFFAWSNWDSPSDSEKNIQWTRKCWEGMRPFLVAGAYGNYVADEGDAVAREAYGPNYGRLADLKEKYDPTNFFRLNHNIRPAREGPVAITA
ncbi:MAG TPA: FAD-binding oxidoreductase [Terriglobales bacterium]|jgi:FAD/FMN-containing dehydrogenase|nr:FAD-binding oxidoreductase [Terriglobales bacterium]